MKYKAYAIKGFKKFCGWYHEKSFTGKRLGFFLPGLWATQKEFKKENPELDMEIVELTIQTRRLK